MHSVILNVCAALAGNDLVSAKKLVVEKMPFVAVSKNTRKYSYRQMVAVFIRDGFVDRYSGDKLVFPPVLRILSDLMPDEFPFHPNWKMSECHMAYWKLLPTIDHVVPVARGGVDDESNWVTTSQMRNSIKSNWLLGEMGWRLHDVCDMSVWDGLAGWFIEYTDAHPEILRTSRYCNSWRNALLSVLSTDLASQS